MHHQYVWLRLVLWGSVYVSAWKLLWFLQGDLNSQQESHALSKPRAGLCQSRGAVKGLSMGSWLRTRGAGEGSLPHHRAWERDNVSRGPPGSATDVPAPNKDEGAREKREKPSAPWQQEDQLCRRAQRPSNPRWAFPPGSFLSMVTLTVSLAAHPALQLVLLGVNSGAGSEAGFAVFFQRKERTLFKACSTFTRFPAQTHPSLSFFCLNEVHCPASCYPFTLPCVCVWILEWVAMPFCRGSSQPRDWTRVSRIAGGFFTIWVTREAHAEVGVFLIVRACVGVWVVAIPGQKEYVHCLLSSIRWQTGAPAEGLLGKTAWWRQERPIALGFHGPS